MTNAAIASSDAIWSFGPARKLPPNGRTVPPEDTLRRVRPLLARVPVTRVADVTPLDVVGLPVFSACTPLAVDLAVNLGKGPDPLSARVSAVMEAIERVSAESVDGVAGCRASFEELCRRPSGRTVLDPCSFTLPPDTAYRPDRPIGWTAGHDLSAGASVWVAADLAVNPPRDGVLVDIDTNGLASGNTHLEAVVHAICEVIERDTFSQLQFEAVFGDAGDDRMPLRAVDLGTLPPKATAVVEQLRAAGYHVILQDITGDLGVATFVAFLVVPEECSADGDSPVPFLGLGTHPDASVALLRSLVEANQSRLACIQGARESFNTGRVRFRTATLMTLLRRLGAGPLRAFADVPSEPSEDLLDDLSFLLGRLRTGGFAHCVAVDLTRPDLGVPVVRVRIPGLSQFMVDMRRVDARCWRWVL